MQDFYIYCDGEEFPEENARALEKAMSGFVQTDIPLAVEFVFVDGEETQNEVEWTYGNAVGIDVSVDGNTITISPYDSRVSTFTVTATYSGVEKTFTVGIKSY